MSAAEPRPIRTFGRRRGRPQRAARAALMRSLLPKLALPESPFDPAALAPWAREVWLEVGFGAGEHLIAQALGAPDVLVMGAEPFENGMAAAVAQIDRLGLGNVRLHAGDARDLIARLPDACLARLYLLFPDPWPKTRHRKRRLVQPAFAASAARVLAPGGQLFFATDWADYVETALMALASTPGLEWTARSAEDWRRPPPDHAPTRYQQKGLGDCAPVWLIFRKRGGAAPPSLFSSTLAT
ncbi:MAG TPA: tRNA (guanosine(46)-N7)-methyltransferase TrmB [Caulobacteraceae bacterium]|nr:tRNA (guanosine(46)-N7)-methyltransferase TrmB [Caulobacteraceae bacterium]